jgi:hypothetical protein
MLQHFSPNRISLNGKRHYIVPEGLPALQEGWVLPSLTTVLSTTAPVGKIMALMNWRKRVGPEEARRRTLMAADRGTWMHKVIEDYFNDEDIELVLDRSPKYRPYFDIIFPFLQTIDKCILAESAIAYGFDGLGYTGTFDQLALIGNEYVLLDWKTSYKEKPDYQLADYRQQLGGYSQAIEQMYKLEIARAICAIAIYDPEDPDSEPSLQIVEADQSELLATGAIVRDRCRTFFAEHYPGGKPFALTMDKG